MSTQLEYPEPDIRAALRHLEMALSPVVKFDQDVGKMREEAAQVVATEIRLAMCLLSKHPYFAIPKL